MTSLAAIDKRHSLRPGSGYGTQSVNSLMLGCHANVGIFSDYRLGKAIGVKLCRYGNLFSSVFYNHLFLYLLAMASCSVQIECSSESLQVFFWPTYTAHGGLLFTVKRLSPHSQDRKALMTFSVQCIVSLFYYPRRARSASAWILFSLWMYFVCLYVCQRSRKKTLDRNDLKLGTVVLLNSPPKPIDFVPNRFRGRGAGGQKRNLGPPHRLL